MGCVLFFEEQRLRNAPSRKIDNDLMYYIIVCAQSEGNGIDASIERSEELRSSRKEDFGQD